MKWKGRKEDRRAATCAIETQATTLLGIKNHEIMEFQLTLVFYAFQLYVIKTYPVEEGEIRLLIDPK